VIIDLESVGLDGLELARKIWEAFVSQMKRVFHGAFSCIDWQTTGDGDSACRGTGLTGAKSEGCEDPASHEHDEVDVHLEHHPDLGLTQMR